MSDVRFDPYDHELVVDPYPLYRRLREETPLYYNEPLDFFAVIDESVLTRIIGGEDVMAGQLQRLIERAQLPNVTVRILPMDAGAHPFLGGPAALLEFYESTHMDVVYLEGIAGDYYAEQPSEVARYRQDFERLSARALDDRMSIKLIESLLRT